MNTLTKADLVKNLSEQIGLSKREAKELVEAFFLEISDILSLRGETVRVSGFGNFRLRDKKSRPGRNPQTGQDFLITPRRVVTFRAGQKLKALIETYDGTQSLEPPQDE